MVVLLIALGSLILYVIAYNTYGSWLASKVFGIDPRAEMPSVQLRDNNDFVPTSRMIVFGHHFTSIAGTGPIVGPAIAIMWGWVPALAWILLGSIFIGAVHDFGSLVVSIRNRGQTVGDIAGRILSPRTRFLFLGILLFGLWIVLAIFGLVIAAVFRMFPESILPVFLQIPIAMAIGFWIHRHGRGLFVSSLLALIAMYLTVWFGAACPGMEWEGGVVGTTIQGINGTLQAWPVWVWTAVLLAYCYFASVMPVWALLQPRDYINSLLLITSLALILVGLVYVGLFGVHGEPVTMVAPAFQWSPLNAPPIMPLLFITIACGAISGFHCLVSSGTSSKQLENEADAQFVGYGSMLTEGFLAVLVVLAVGAGIGIGWPDHATFGGQKGTQLWNSIYSDWAAADAGLSTKIGAFVVGSANFLEPIGVSHKMALAIMGVLVASFAGTTLDTATRLQRYVIEELSRAFQQHVPGGKVLRPFENPHVATLTAVLSAFALSLFPKPGQPWTWETIGQGGMILWPMFGATNQLLGGLAFLVITFWLWRRNKPIWFVAIPTVFMLVMPAWAMLIQIGGWWNGGNYLLLFIAVFTLVFEVWMIIEALLVFPRVRGVLEDALPPLPTKALPAT